MKHYVEYSFENSKETVMLEVDETTSETVGHQRVALKPDKLAYKAETCFNEALRRTINPITAVIMSEIKSLSEPPNEFEATFGLKFSINLGTIVTAGSDANFQITLKWRKA